MELSPLPPPLSTGPIDNNEWRRPPPSVTPSYSIEARDILPDTLVSKSMWDFDFSKDERFVGPVMFVPYTALSPSIKNQFKELEWKDVQKELLPSKVWMVLLILSIIGIFFLPLYMRKSLTTGCTACNKRYSRQEYRFEPLPNWHDCKNVFLAPQ